MGLTSIYAEAAGEIDVFAFRTRFDSPDDLELWAFELSQAVNVCEQWLESPDDAVLIVHGVAKLEEIQRSDSADGWVRIDPSKVGRIELVPLSAPIADSVAAQIEAEIAEFIGSASEEDL